MVGDQSSSAFTSPKPESATMSRQTTLRPTSVYVSLTRLPASEKLKYTELPGQFLVPELDERVRVDEVVGEYVDAIKGPLYYGRYEGGIIYGFPAQAFAERYPGLIETYNNKKSKGLLSDFRPDSQEVHPRWRVRFRVTISNRRASVSISSAHGSQYVNDSDAMSDSELEGSDDENYGEELGARRRTRRSTRKNERNSKLMFSPRKTRSTTVYPIPGSSEEDESDVVGKRRSSRMKRPMRIVLDESGHSNSDSEYGYLDTRKSRKATSQKKRSKAARPAYGHFRSIDDLNYDDDDQTRALRAHRDICEKCHRRPAHLLLAAEMKKAKNGRKRRKISEGESGESDDAVESLTSLGGWVRCLKCPVSAHWRCLARTQQDEILKATRERDRAEWLKAHEGEQLDVEKDGPQKRAGLEVEQTTEFICGSCMKGGVCMGCMKVALEPDAASTLKGENQSNVVGSSGNLDMHKTSTENQIEETTNEVQDQQLFFRCFTCKRLAHYKHIELGVIEDVDDLVDAASHYQKNWLCIDCASYHWTLDKILAWRPYPPNTVEPSRAIGEPANYKAALPREYLVKWQERGYRRTQWVPHMWLLSTSPGKLKNFIADGPKVELRSPASDRKPKEVDEEPSGLFDISRESSAKPNNAPQSPQTALVDAESRIPLAWKTVDRVLDIQLRRSRPKQKSRKNARTSRSSIESEDESESDNTRETFRAAFEQGEEPAGYTESLHDFETRTGSTFDPEEHIDLVVWAFFKWEDLGYEEATWDSPPEPKDPTYPAFQRALKRFVAASTVIIPRFSKEELRKFENRPKGEYRRKYAIKSAAELTLAQDPKLQLMPFQVDGFNWLCSNWWDKQPCILADEMGLGKTVQITSFIGKIVAKYSAQPVLVVVPNSTITNWVREFERWAPGLRVVPFYGESKAREVIKNFELSHQHKRSGETGAKFHVLVTTYEALINPRDFGTVFKSQPRWEVLVVDEGQRLKSDSSLLFKKLNELNTAHRIIMTGTPLNNNMRELFNLMNFLDPVEWNDLDALEKEYADLNEDLVKQLHNLLRPYFLRRIKSEVLDLPPKNEVIVPVSMTSLQKEVYRSILSHNAELLQGLTQPSTNTQGGARKSSINNMLMQLRKCLQHPYLYHEDIEPRGLSAVETHEKLIDASAKLRLLRDLLPKLKARGHRVLVFSQFSLALNVVEDFLVGEGHKYLRLDGNTKGTDRQKGMDEFNRPGSDIFVYLLTTRAGGVGINLFTADTVIIFDPDFNPHQDLQAIARAHRFGQKKTCLVFKLMVKNSAEERIMQIGKKKLVLDHLIVQKMDDDDSAGENVQSILTYGAQTLFESEESSSVKDIVYSETDIDKLIEKTEKEGDQEEVSQEGAGALSFAKIWTADKDELDEVGDDDQADSWALTLQKINEERTKLQSKEAALSGRGARRKAAVTRYVVEDSPQKQGRSRSKASVDGSAYTGSGISDGEESVSEAQLEEGDNDVQFLTQNENKKGKSKASTADERNGMQYATPEACGLCGRIHGTKDGDCSMTESSENLVEYREMLLMHADDEPYEQRCAAVNAIDEVLRRRGHQSLIISQPLYPVRPRVSLPSKRAKKVTGSAQSTRSGLYTEAAPPPSRMPSTATVPHRARVAESSGPKPISNDIYKHAFTTNLLTTQDSTKNFTVNEPVPSARTLGWTAHDQANSQPRTSVHSSYNRSGIASIAPGQSSFASKASAASSVTKSSTHLRTESRTPGTYIAGPSRPTSNVTSNAVQLNAMGSARPGGFSVGASAESKRPSSPSGPSSSKRLKASCAVCERALHTLKDCPVARGSSEGILKAITRLTALGPEMGPHVDTLRRILSHRKKNEIGALPIQ